MSILHSSTSTPAAPATGDDAAIAELHAAFKAQRAAFHTDRQPSLEERRARIGRLIEMLLGHRERISAALNSDFGSHPAPASDLIEVLGPVGRAQFVLQRLEDWMKPVPREVDPAVMGSATAYIQYQPKGVVGNIVPWNFPFDLSVGPMIEMLAAGNRVMIKPSEFTPACAVLLREMVAEAFDPTLVDVATGGLELARAFSELALDHLLYTGSANVGRQVKAAAARNLMPVTLELGGKCPAVLTPGAVTATSVEQHHRHQDDQERPDVHLGRLLPGAARRARSVRELAVDHVRRVAADYSRSPDCTGIISVRHLDRLSAMLQEARERGCRVVDLEADGGVDRATRRMPLSLVIDPAPDLRIMQEEIFGPILPVVPYDTVDGAIEASTPATGRSGSTCSATIPRSPSTSSATSRRAARRSTRAPRRARCRRWRSAASAPAAWGATTASKASASSPTRAAW